MADIEPEFAGQAKSETVRTPAAARRAMAFRVGKATVFALAKRANADWDATAMANALSKVYLLPRMTTGMAWHSSADLKEGIKLEMVAA